MCRYDSGVCAPAGVPLPGTDLLAAYQPTLQPGTQLFRIWNPTAPSAACFLSAYSDAIRQLHPVFHSTIVFPLLHLPAVWRAPAPYMRPCAPRPSITMHLLYPLSGVVANS